MYSDEITKYKMIVLETFWQNDNLKSLILDKAMNYETFRNHVFPYARNPNTITEQGTYILFDADCKKSSHENLAKYSLYFWVISHDALQITPDGVLVDLITKEIEKEFLDCRKFGIGKLEYSGNPIFNTPSGFYGRSLTYYTTEFWGEV